MIVTLTYALSHHTLSVYTSLPERLFLLLICARVNCAPMGMSIEWMQKTPVDDVDTSSLRVAT